MLNKITNRILLGYSIPLICLVGLGGVIYATTNHSFKVQDDAEQTAEDLKDANEMAYDIARMLASARGHLISPKDPSHQQAYEAAYKAFQKNIRDLETVTTVKEKEWVTNLTQQGESFYKIGQTAFQQVDDNKLSEAKVTLEKIHLELLDERRNQLVQELENHLKQDTEELNRSQQFLLGLIVMATSITILLTLAIGLWISLPLKQQLPKVVEAAENIAHGDLTQTIEVGTDKSEIGQLLAAFHNMTKSLNSLIFQAQKSGIQISTSTTQIAAAGKELEATVSEQVASINEVSATSQQISATAGNLAKTMDQVAQMAESTAVAASNSQVNLDQMQMAMQRLAHATTSISSKLGVMDEKASNINTVVTTITKVADQTNLLSLNAAIEAEKAGEYGAGFAVVAREIRRLADQTAVATLEIEQMVKEMQSSVSTGVMEMDKFSKEVGQYVEEVGKISGQVAQVIQDMQSLTPRFEAVNQSMDEQYQGAQQISTAIAQLSEASQQTVQSLQETNTALTQLDDAAQGLQQEISQFKVRA